MLVLSRKLNERIVFPSVRISVQVVTVQGGKVRLGIEAPAEIRVLREEICQDSEPPQDDGERKQAAVPDRLAGLSEGLKTTVAWLWQLRQQMLDGLHPDALATLDQLEHEIRSLRGELRLARAP